jgi:hypothetical protein
MTFGECRKRVIAGILGLRFLERTVPAVVLPSANKFAKHVFHAASVADTFVE